MSYSAYKWKSKVTGHSERADLSSKAVKSSIPVLAALIGVLNAPASAQQLSQPPQQGQTPAIERADDKKSKITFAVYFLSNDRNYDINLRHQFGHVVAWLAGFYDPKGDSQARIGAEYDFQHKWLLFIPTLEVGSNGALAGSLYAELGSKNYGIVGYSQTNLKPFNDLFFDPSESLQLGAGRKINQYDKIYGYTIFDVRLHTHQQDTHVLWRHKLNSANGITVDGLYKSGHGDDGAYVRAVGIGVYYDRPSWFWKAYYDPHVNFSSQTMVRAGVGLKF